MPDDSRLQKALIEAGEWKVAAAFKQSVFVYGTKGSGSRIVAGLRNWAGKTRRSKEELARAGYKVNTPAWKARDARPVNEEKRQVIERTLNLFDPGRRAAAYIGGNHQMMDLYYGQANTSLHTRRIPAIAEFVHHAMGFKGPFSMNQSGREAYMETFKTTIEGWDGSTPSKTAYDGLTATKEMSRIIRWGIHRFGGKLIYEGREVYYGQVFDKNAPYIGDTDLEARELFRYCRPGMSNAPFGKGRLVFHWCGIETVPTKVHFLTNWTRTKDRKKHQIPNMATKTFAKDANLLPIWNNFSSLPRSLCRFPEQDVAAVIFEA